MTLIAKTRYYQGRVAYPSSEQLRAGRATWDFDDVRRPTEDVDCTHIQRIEISGRDAQEARLIEKETLERFFDYIGHRSGFRVLTHRGDDWLASRCGDGNPRNCLRHRVETDQGLREADT